MADEQVAAPDPGQAAPAPEVGQAVPPMGGQTNTWTPLKLGDQEFKTKEELEKAWKDSYLRQDDYTRKTQSVAQLRKQYDQKMKEIENREKEFQAKVKEYEHYDNFLKSRPDAYQTLQRMLNQPPSPEVAYQRAESLVNDKTGEIEKKLQEFEEWKKQQEIEREKGDVFSRLAQELPDFNPQTIEERLASLRDADFEVLARLLYHAERGEKSPLEVERKITDKLKQKGGVKTTSPKGAPPSETKFKSIDEGRLAALRDAQGG